MRTPIRDPGVSGVSRKRCPRSTRYLRTLLRRSGSRLRNLRPGHCRREVDLAWVRSKGAVTSILLGARTSQQLEDNLGVLETTLSTDQLARLDARSAIEPGFPHALLAAPMNQFGVSGGVKVSRR